MLTSTLPFVSGVTDNGKQLAPGAVTLAGILRQHGFRTAAFIGGFVLDARFGLNQGFDEYDSSFGTSSEAGKDPGEIRRAAPDVIDAASRWLLQNSDAPFLIFVHLYDLHTPRVHARDGYSAYDAELSYVDQTLGTFRRFLVKNGLWEHSLTVLTSDHGESLGEHGESTHGYFIYQSTQRVPLIIHWPKGAGSFRKRVPQPVSLLDVSPTILKFLSFAQPPQFEGHSLMDRARGKDSYDAEEVYSESRYGHAHFGTSSLRALRIARYKYIDAPRPEFFDLEQDPAEHQDLIATKSDLAAIYKVKLHTLVARYGASNSRSAPLSPQAVGMLKSLGYIAESGGATASAESGIDPKDRIRQYEMYEAGMRLSSNREWIQADSIFEQLLAADPSLTDVRISLGLDQQLQGNHEAAGRTFQEVLQRDPTNLLGHFNLAVSYFNLGELEKSVKELQVTLAIAPYYTNAEDILGLIYLHERDHIQARLHFEHVLAIDPDDYSAHYGLGTIFLLERKLADGLPHLREAVQISPGSSDARNSLGSLYLLQGDLPDAEVQFSEVIRLKPADARAHYNLGLAFRGQGKVADAEREFATARTLDPALPDPGAEAK